MTTQTQTQTQADPSAPIKGRMPTLLEARTVHEITKSQLAKLKLDLEKGVLVNAEDERKSGFALGRTIRDSIMAIPLRVSSILAAETDEFVVRELLTEELTRALKDLAQ